MRIQPLSYSTLTNPNAGTKKDWSLGEWITNFIESEGYDYYDDDAFIDDYYDDAIAENDYGDFDEGGVIESILILGVMTALVFLLWWRQRMQQAHAQREEDRRREQGLPPRPIPQGAPAGRPNPGDVWAAGPIGL